VLTGPLIVLNVVLSVVFARLTGGYAGYGLQGSLGSTLLFGLVMAEVGLFVAVAVINFLAGVFKGSADFSRAFAAVSLAGIPAWLAGIVGALVPGFGFLISLAGGIVTLVFLYQILPLALAIPAGKRVAHFVTSLVAIIVVNAVIAMAVGAGALRGQMQYGGGSPAVGPAVIAAEQRLAG